ncbi:Xenotropic and polytropic retrovirus receptor 1 [Neophaeococcomyces mojaviensis]|uniref:Xenotropic and polytropic retrovirus receptor 1 n=1 Tax=Neophaeococcomyces mojaviensis TaxID=3383035 RepID=A0ACC2ZRW4_9EURO|nr:Xenotropic and polytropic retrovirus receptor 1 [Knufia sp. JES_112]
MKFAKELEDDLVPEWRAKYINYKLGKKKIKAISKALRNANRTPKIKGRPPLSAFNSFASIPYTHYDFSAREARAGAANSTPAGTTPGVPDRRQLAALRRMSTTMFTTSPPIRIQRSHSESDDELDSGNELEEERTPLKKARSAEPDGDASGSHGSYPPSEGGDPESIPTTPAKIGHMPRLSLPDPALDPARQRTNSANGVILQKKKLKPEEDGNRVINVENTEPPTDKKENRKSLMKVMFQRKKDQSQPPWTTSSSGRTPKQDRVKDVFKSRDIHSPDMTTAQQQAYNELDVRQDDFFSFLDKELDKIEKFYKSKEEEAKERLTVLRAQLHEHRDQRARDMHSENVARKNHQPLDGHVGAILAETPLPNDMGKKAVNGTLFGKVFKHEPHIGKTSKAMENLASPPQSPQTQENNANKDYTKRRPTAGNEHVPHKFAKRRLKLALQEFYRGMELLKSYALLNRTGFRKINKKYDKAVNARPPLRYLNEKVSKAYFVKSTVVDEYLVAVEDLYARYFERGNRKIAVSKLRSRLQQGDQSGPSFRNGLWLAGGVGFGITGLYNGFDLLYRSTGELKVQTAYLLQLYAGYFLALLLFLLFVLDCRIWTKARINYVFVFEYDTRHVLDWRQLAEIPCFFLFLNGLFIWLNFEFGEIHPMYLYWPVVLIGLTLLIMALPFKILYYHARKWWAFSNFRLLFAGIYPVEFRDFFLGDMYCSATYSMSQIELFFCLYRWNWKDPPRCNSNHSMLLGFFTTLPGIWRFLQCIRRYHDSGKWFPHLANCAKYMCNILYYMTLSLYRLNLGSPISQRYRIAFIVFACLNGVYCSLWDVFMDWSLGDFFSRHRGLRDQLAYRREWVYYVAIVVNTILRHQWIFYAIFTSDLQHSAAMSFFVSLSEVLRRGMWTFFRVENEHTNNVKSYRASRDIPLPYSIPQSPLTTALDDQTQVRKRAQPSAADRSCESQRAYATGTDHDLERQTSSETTSSTARRRISISNTPALRALQRVGTAVAAAHSQDFQRRRRPEVVGDSPADETMLKDGVDEGSSDDDDDHYREEIEGSIAGDDDDRSPTDNGRTQGQEANSNRNGGRNGGEGSSGDAREEVDIGEVRRLAEEFHPESGLSGLSKQGGPSGSGRKQKET